MMNAAVLLS